MIEIIEVNSILRIFLIIFMKLATAKKNQIKRLIIILEKYKKLENKEI